MVVSNPKRKRKESPPPPPTSAIESSPEMPKRTKVQAQRKFAQGQNVPTSSYSSVNVASSSSNTGPSTSSESREPPTDILPNKKPKTEDFLTFLCFRGTRALPAHLDFLNQGKPKETEPVESKNLAKPKAAKKGRKGRPKNINKKIELKGTTAEVTTSSTDAVNATTNTNTIVGKTVSESLPEIKDKKNKTPVLESSCEETVIPFAVRKRAEVVADGNRRSRVADRLNRGATDVDKCNNLAEVKRRSNRSAAKDGKQGTETIADGGDLSDNEYLSKVEDNKELVAIANERKKTKTPLSQGRNSATPSKESEKEYSKNTKRSSSVANKLIESLKDDINELSNRNSPKLIQKQEQSLKDTKEKPPVKRPRQKESPIFIPSPEPSGRMTRQRAFFEPVKVPHREDTQEVGDKSIDTVNEIVNKKVETVESLPKVEVSSVKEKEVEKIGIENGKPESIKVSRLPADKTKSKANVFDFSSDDEQPLAKSIKLKKEKIAKKTTPRVNSKVVEKTSPKKSVDKKNEIKPKSEIEISKNFEQKEIAPTDEMIKLETETKVDISNEMTKAKPKRGKGAKKKNESIEEIDSKEISAQQTPKKIKNARQSRKKIKTETQVVNGENKKIVASIPRNQRPTRKTKERATIYMGIIGHKLQLAEDDDDDLSLNSYPDLPNVKEMEKMENELKLKAQSNSVEKQISTSPILQKKVTSQTKPESQGGLEKPIGARRGRPPKQPKPEPVKREIEGMLVKKGTIAKITTPVEKMVEKSEPLKADTDDEDFLLNEEVNETKRKLERSFSDSDDEPLAIKANSKSVDKDTEDILKKIDIMDYDSDRVVAATALTMLPLAQKPVLTPPMTSHQINISPITTPTILPTSQTPSPFKTIEKKSPVPTSKILNVPATYGVPSTTSVPASPNFNSSFNKTSYLPQMTPHYHGNLVRTPTHQFPTAKSPTVPAPVPTPSASVHLSSSLSQQSPIKYQTTPTTYPPPIEAYPSPKINPNFLTPKFDRTTLPRPNNFPSPSPVKFDAATKAGLAGHNLQSPKTPAIISGTSTLSAINTSASTSAAAVAVAAATNSADPLKDEIGSILAANLMPSKEESGKIFGIASVSLAQSSGPDNTKCTLGKCGSIHKPVLGPVVPTEGYIGDQLSSKERRKAKVNMTHEQIQKWLIECSSNPDEIQDDLDDDFDDNLRPNHFATTPPPTRDDKESTSFSSSSKATRDFGKSESAWSTKGPSLKATPVIASSNRKEETKLIDLEVASETNRSASGQAINLTHKSASKTNTNLNENKQTKEKVDKKVEKKSAAKESGNKDNKQNKTEKEKEKEKEASNSSKHTNSAVMQHQSSLESSSTTKPSRKKNFAQSTVTNVEDKGSTTKVQKAITSSSTAYANPKTPKRTPVYNQKTPKQSPNKESPSTGKQKGSNFSFGAFSVDNEKSIYSFDKYDEDDKSKQESKSSLHRQTGHDTENKTHITTPTAKTSPTKKKGAAAATEKSNKDIANPSQNSSVSLTLSPSEKSKLIKVSLDAENTVAAKASAGSTTKAAKKNEVTKTNDCDSDSDGHTFYIPLQGSGAGCDAEGGIQGVAVKLGREGPEGPNQKVIMHATLVTKAQMGSNTKPLPESMNASDIVKTLITSSNNTNQTSANSAINETSKNATATGTPNLNITPSTSAAAAAAAASSTSNSLKSVPIGTVQPRFKASDSTTNPASTSGLGTGNTLVRVNSSSSLFSGSAKSKIGGAGTSSNKKFKDDTPIKMSNNTAFPRKDDPTQMVEAPIFRPTEKEFADPIEFIERITPIAARFGICKIIPPANFKPECRISDEMRFTAYNQYVHKMLYRWGPSAKELSAIKKYLTTQSIVMNTPPWIGGMEVDLPRLYHTVQELGGLKEVIEKKKWARVAEEMCIPKLAQDRVTKLDDIYCKYLLPYDTLSPAERQKLFDEVEADWAKREARARRNADRFANTESGSNEDDISSENEESEEEIDGVSMECIVKGRSMPLSQFYRIARNTMALWFKNTEPTVNDVEAEFWRHVAVRDSHVCVHSGSIDSSGWGYGFPSPGPKGKGSNYARHPWNLKVLTNNPGSVLRSLGPVMGVTVPTLHVGMLFSACCWYRDPHGLSWIEYLHTGASKLWYGIPDDQSANFRSALTSLIPTHCQNKTIWLPCDTVMVPPHMLTDRGVSLCRIEQKPGEFIVVFPRAYTSSLGTGYVVSESVYFATTTWLDLAKDDFKDIHDSCEPAMFSLEQLLFTMGYDQRVSLDTLQQMLPMLNDVFEKETSAREKLKSAGVTTIEKVQNEKGTKAKKQQQPPLKLIDGECDLCRANLYISMVKTDEGSVYCLQHALKNLNNGNLQAKQSKLIFAYSVEDIQNLIKHLKDKLHQKKSAVTNKKGK
ncbi:uncharacterized protein LOC119668417 [Teleopsis dalmanni]|uniref:uncharacterized protein LOC119668417 n=1 Tax=Teleopsis dalmanni TaxID=139649 RepID=UPI0018CE45CD|nr:uncharacterized protein LOC119668417 [Teleopsis dalmanni]